MALDRGSSASRRRSGRNLGLALALAGLAAVTFGLTVAKLRLLSAPPPAEESAR